MKKVLLTTVHKPLGLENENVTAELYHAQVTKAQGIFSLRSIFHGWGLDFMAKNLKTPTTVLHYPSMREFKRELKKGYDYVGITFVMSTWGKARELIAVVRKESPNTKVILGGYGTVIGEIDQYADYVCRGEGLQFMQKLLGEKPTTRPKMPQFINRSRTVSLPTGSSGIILGGIGCPNGCEFCATTHFFKKEHFPILKTGRDVYDAMLGYDDVITSRNYAVIDEDFLKDKERMEDLYKYTSSEIGMPRSFACFSSSTSILQYTPEWLFELGVDTIWVGVESNMHDFEKNRGVDIKKMFKDLNDVGINILGSSIVGVDAHTPENIWGDIDNHISLEPTLSQFLVFSPCPTTPLWDRLEKSGKLIKDYPYNKRDGFHLMFKHDNFSAEEIEKIQQQAFEKEYKELGPSVMRFIDVALRGYNHFKDSKKPIHMARVKKVRKVMMDALPLFGTIIRNAPSEKVKQKAIRIREELLSIATRKERNISRVMSLAMPFFSAYTKYKQAYSTRDRHPKMLRNEYNSGL